jgi:hypothetical protein
MNFTQAQAYCKNQATTGLNDWRAPNIVELATLVDYTSSSPPFLNVGVFTSSQASNYWSGSADFENTGQAWYIRTSSDGAVEYQSNSTSLPVRCCRSCYPVPGTSRYSISTSVAANTVVDTVTGLIWQKMTPSNTYSQADSATYCSGLSLGGYVSGWRLPTVRELLSLVDYSTTGSAAMIDPVAFFGEPADTFWSSSGLWDIWFNGGYFGRGASNHRVRCVQPCPTPFVTGLLAAWNATGGLYSDATNQTGRYSESFGVVTDALTGIQWQQLASQVSMNWTVALTYCGTQNTGGLGGWRLPNVIELQTLVDYTILFPSTNAAAFPNTPITLGSSTPAVGNPGYVWGIYFYGGNVGNATEATLSSIRCMRSCYPTPPSSRYRVALGEVTDSVTGLIWQQHAPTTGGPNNNGRYNWSGAAGYCAGFNLNGHVWRLPSAKELTTIVDYSVNRGSLMMDSVFVGEPVNWFWSSSPLAGLPSHAWVVNFNVGYVSASSVSPANYARCVR